MQQPQPQQQQRPQDLGPYLQIQHIDDWLRFNGLRSPDDDPPEAPEYGSFLSDLNRSEAHAKHEEQQRYQEETHARIFREHMEAEQELEATRKRYLEAWEDEEMEIVTNERIFTVPLSPMAAACDLIFTMASSRRYMDNVLGKNNNNSSEEEKTNLNPVRLSLKEYPAGAVQEFLHLILCDKEFHNMESQHVVDCCHIGHYLQCNHVLDGTSNILLQNVDSDNCLSICQLADQLELTDLFERALFHMLKSLNDLENQEAYEAFSPALKERIADIRTVFTNHSADNSMTSKKALRLYFTSLEEYIAIFAENVQYHRERLEEAKEQNAADFSSYAQKKIEKQELRVLTLEAMLQEQKKMFGNKRTVF